MKTINTFKERVIDVVKKIPKGKVMSYGKVSECAGVFGASRAVGSIMSRNIDKTVPCHRVVRSDGSIGEYNGLRTAHTGKSAKQKLLESEGVRFTKSGKVVFNREEM